MKSKQETRLPETCKSGTLVDRRLLWLQCVLDQPAERPSFYSQETHLCAAHSGLPAPTEMHIAPAQKWPAWTAWCCSSSPTDQDGNLYIEEDSKNPSVTGLRHSVYPVADLRPLAPNAHSSTPAAAAQTSSHCTHTQTGLSSSWSRPLVSWAAIFQALWLAKYPEPQFPSSCLPDLLSCSLATLAWFPSKLH